MTMPTTNVYLMALEQRTSNTLGFSVAYLF